MGDRAQIFAAQQIGELARVNFVALIALLRPGRRLSQLIAHPAYTPLRFTEFLAVSAQDSGPSGLRVRSRMNFAFSTGFEDGFHDQFPTAVQDGDPNRYLVHVHSDTFDVVTHLSRLLGGKSFVPTLTFSYGKVPSCSLFA
jgi:hypothetical protein